MNLDKWLLSASSSSNFKYLSTLFLVSIFDLHWKINKIIYSGKNLIALNNPRYFRVSETLINKKNIINTRHLHFFFQYRWFIHNYIVSCVSNINNWPVIWGCWIHPLYLCEGLRSLANDCPEYDTRQSDGEASVLELWGIWSTSSLPLLPGPF